MKRPKLGGSRVELQLVVASGHVEVFTLDLDGP